MLPGQVISEAHTFAMTSSSSCTTYIYDNSKKLIHTKVENG